MQDFKRPQKATSSQKSARHIELSEREQAWANEFAAEGVCLVGSRSSDLQPFAIGDTGKH